MLLFFKAKLEGAVAQIELRPDTIGTSTWWLNWVERNEVVGRVDQDLRGRCTVVPVGSHWSPMKRLGRSFDSPEAALREVQLYFEHR